MPDYSKLPQVFSVYAGTPEEAKYLIRVQKDLFGNSISIPNTEFYYRFDQRYKNWGYDKPSYIGRGYGVSKEYTFKEFKDLVEPSSLPAKWAIQRISGNHRKINAWFSMEYRKNYTGSGSFTDMDGETHDTYMHYPKVKGSKVVLDEVADGYTLITYQTFLKEVLKEKEPMTKQTFVLPEKWTVHVKTREEDKVLMSYIDKEYGFSPSDNWRDEGYWYTSDSSYAGTSEPEDYTNISFEDFKTHVLKDTFVLPKQWSIRGSEEFKKWVIEYDNNNPENRLNVGGYAENNYYYIVAHDNNYKGRTWSYVNDTRYPEITFEQFKKYVLKQEPIKTVTTMDMNEKVVIPIAFLKEVPKDATAAQIQMIKDNVDLFTQEATKTFVKKFYEEEVQPSCQWKKKIADQFPFVKEEVIDLSTGKFDGKDFLNTNYTGGTINDHLMAVRSTGKFQNKGFILNNNYNWSIEKDVFNQIVIVPTKKK